MVRISKNDCVLKVCTARVTDVEIYNSYKAKKKIKIPNSICYELNDALCYVHIKTDFVDNESYQFRMMDSKSGLNIYTDSIHFGKFIYGTSNILFLFILNILSKT